MELPGTGYLYTLATVSITFVGFSALLIFFRQTAGGGVTKYDSYFMLSFMQPGFIVTGGALLPPLLALLDLAADTVWRVSSVLSAIPIFLFVVTVPSRRRAAVDEPIPIYITTLLLVQAFGGLLLVANAIGWPFAPAPGPYAGALSVLLFTTGIAYLRAFALSTTGHRPARHPRDAATFFPAALWRRPRVPPGPDPH